MGKTKRTTLRGLSILIIFKPFVFLQQCDNGVSLLWLQDTHSQTLLKSGAIHTCPVTIAAATADNYIGLPAYWGSLGGPAGIPICSTFDFIMVLLDE